MGHRARFRGGKSHQIGGFRRCVGRPIPVAGMEPAARRKLGDIFVQRGLITTGQLDEALAAQRERGGRLGELLVELGFVTRVALAGVITEQWDELRVTTRAQKTAAVAETRADAPATSVVEVALRERLEAMQAELAAKDARIAQQDATIAALLDRVGGHAGV